MITSCPACSKRFEVDSSSVGRQATCPSCHKPFTIAEASAEAPPAAANTTSAPAPAPEDRAAGKNPACACHLPWATIGRVAIFVGFALIILCRGWDAVGNRSVMRVQAKNTYKMQELQRDKDVKDLDKQQKELTNEIEEASASNIAWGYWRECLFPVGAIILVGGLVALGMVGVGAERIVSMIMLSIITFSLFIGGAAWLSSIVDNVMSAASQVKHAF
jgi:hypothetical protein